MNRFYIYGLSSDIVVKGVEGVIWYGGRNKQGCRMFKTPFLLLDFHPVRCWKHH